MNIRLILKNILDYFEGGYIRNKHWIFFLTYCIGAAAVTNLYSDEFFEAVVVVTFELFLFGVLAWILLNGWTKTQENDSKILKNTNSVNIKIQNGEVGDVKIYGSKYESFKIWSILFFENEVLLNIKSEPGGYEECLSLSREDFKMLLKCIPDWENICKINEQKFLDIKKEYTNAAPLNFYFYDNWHIDMSIYNATPGDYVFFSFFPLPVSQLTIEYRLIKYKQVSGGIKQVIKFY